MNKNIGIDEDDSLLYGIKEANESKRASKGDMMDIDNGRGVLQALDCCITLSLNRVLDVVFIADEVLRTIFDMALLKASRISQQSFRAER
ncbi:hypothetical protein ACOSQ4_017140 [Xanthoceras sorbifolium]